MRFWVSILLLICSLHVFGQDWALFPYGQESIYSQCFFRVEVLEIDSAKDNTWYFNSKAPASFSQDTFDLIKKAVNSDVWFDSISVSGDTSYWHTPYGNVPFYNLAKENEIYLYNDYWYFECIDVDTQTVFGVVDSTREFMVFCDDLGSSGGPCFLFFTISKKHGFLSFNHPSLFFGYAYTELVTDDLYNLRGFTRDGIKKGVELADWSNFALLEPADRLTYHQYDGINSNYTQHFILHTERSDSIFTYTYRPKSLNEEGESGLNGMRSKTYPEASFTPILSAKSYTPVLIGYDSLYEAGVISFRFVRNRRFWSENDSVLHTLVSYDNYYKIPYSHIESSGLVDVSESHVLNTTVGDFITHINPTWSYRVTKLIGIQTADTLWGVDVFTQLSGSSSNSPIQYYPNPAHSNITVTGLTQANFFWQVFDLTGRRLLFGNQSQPVIDVSPLAAGSYVLTIEGIGQAIFQKE